MALSYDIPYMWNVKRNDTNELIYKTERRLTDLWLLEGSSGVGIAGEFGIDMYIDG